MTRVLHTRALCGLVFCALFLPLTAAGQVFKLNKDLGDTARAMSGCWPNGTTNASDTGPGSYAWSLDVTSNDIIARVLSQAAAGTPATITFSTSGTVVIQGSATATEGDTAAPTVTLNGISVTAAGPTPGTCPSCSRVSDFSVTLDSTTLAAAGVAACGSDDLLIEIEVEGDATTTCATFTNSHSDAVWRGQGVYPTIKPRLTVDSSQPGC